MSTTKSRTQQKREKKHQKTQPCTEQSPYAMSTASALDGFDLNIAEAALERFKKQRQSQPA